MPETRHNQPSLPVWLDDLVASAEPAVVFTSVAQLSVAALSDTCLVAIEQDDDLAYLIARPRSTTPDRALSPRVLLPASASSCQLLARHAVSTPIAAPAYDGEMGYRGVLIQRWTSHEPTLCDAALARMAVAQAVAVVQRERIVAALEESQHTVQNLQRALATCREIGVAVGILMSSQRITHSQAFELLSSASRSQNRKVRDIAAEVVLTGALELPPPAPGRFG